MLASKRYVSTMDHNGKFHIDSLPSISSLIRRAVLRKISYNQKRPSGEQSKTPLDLLSSINCVFLQAVKKLKDEIAGMDEQECGDALVLPLYAALPPDQQVISPLSFLQ